MLRPSGAKRAEGSATAAERESLERGYRLLGGSAARLERDKWQNQEGNGRQQLEGEPSPRCGLGDRYRTCGAARVSRKRFLARRRGPVPSETAGPDSSQGNVSRCGQGLVRIPCPHGSARVAPPSGSHSSFRWRTLDGTPACPSVSRKGRTRRRRGPSGDRRDVPALVQETCTRRFRARRRHR